jgi:disulfide bond formation protein DsbB
MVSLPLPASIRPTPRLLFAAIFLACVGLLGFGLYLQHVVGLEPCPLCILQRIAFVFVGVVALAAAIHGPGLTGVRAYAGVMGLFSLTGAGIAARHVFLQRFPPLTGSCGVEMEFLLENFPLTQALPKIFSGGGDCVRVSWRFLGLSIPEWALLWFLLLAGASAWILLRKPE